MAFLSKNKYPQIFDHYLTGLGLLSKSDILLKFDNNALEAFTNALQLLLQEYFGVSLESFINDPAGSVGGVCEEWEQEDKSRLKSLVDWVYSDKKSKFKAQPDDVAIVKILFDSLFNKLARNAAQKKLEAKREE